MLDIEINFDQPAERISRLPALARMHPLLPTHPQSERKYSLDEFLEMLDYRFPVAVSPVFITPGTLSHALNTAALNSFTLYKHHSWIEWRHEFVVLNITFLGEDYLIHINRAWAAPDGWRQYVPPITWGSHKPANDEVVIYLPGAREYTARYGTHSVASFDLSEVTLGYGYLALKELRDRNPEYSLVGVNCWAFSRAFAWVILYQRGSEVRNGFIAGRPMSAGAVDLLTFLQEGGPWALIPYAGILWEENDGCMRLLRQVDFILEVILHGSKIYRHLRGKPYFSPFILSSEHKNAPGFLRLETLMLTSAGELYHGGLGEVSLELSNSDCHDAPPFGVFNVAYDKLLPEIPPIQALCRPGDFLYLLTPPITSPVDPIVPRFYIVAQVTSFDWEIGGQFVKSTESDSWTEYGVVRRDGQSGNISIVCRRRLAFDQTHQAQFVGFLGDAFRPGDMIGVWIRAPADTTLPPRPTAVNSAVVSLGFGKFFKESRCAPAPQASSDTPSSGVWQILGASMKNIIQPGWGSRSRLEFARVQRVKIVFNGPHLALTAGDCTSGESPHSFDPCGLTINPNNAEDSNQLSKPDDVLYLLTSPIRMSPEGRVLSVTLYTWSHQAYEGDLDPGHWVSFELGRVKRSHAGGELQEQGLRQEVSRRYPPMRASEAAVDLKRHRHRIDQTYPFVQGLEDGDMIGLWVRVHKPGASCIVGRALVVVETDSETSKVGRYVYMAYGEVRERFLYVEEPFWAYGVVISLGILLFVRILRSWKAV